MKKLQSIKTKFLIGLVLILLFSGRVSAVVISFVNTIYQFPQSWMVYINTGINIFMTSLFIYLVLNVFILKPLDKISKSVKEVANGNLKEKVNIKFNGELNDLANDLNKAISNLNEKFSDID